MRAIVIDPFDQSVTEVVISGNNLKEIYTILDVTCIDAARLENGDVIYVDDEGLLKSPSHFFHLPGITNEPLAGRGLLVGSTPDGSDGPPRYALDEIASATKFYTLIGTATGSRLFEIPHALRGRTQ